MLIVGATLPAAASVVEHHDDQVQERDEVGRASGWYCIDQPRICEDGSCPHAEILEYRPNKEARTAVEAATTSIPLSPGSRLLSRRCTASSLELLARSAAEGPWPPRAQSRG